MALGDMNAGLLSRLMNASSLRHEVLAHNLANQNTPGFTRRVVDFESLVREAAIRGDDTSRIEPKIVPDTVTPPGDDGNNVNLELELNALRENQLLFDTYAGILKSNFDILRSSIQTR